MQLWFRTSITCGTHHRRRAFYRHSKAFHSFCTLFRSTGKNFQQQPFAYIFRAEKAFSFTFLQHFSHLMEILFGITFSKAIGRLFFTLDLRPADCGFRHWFFRNAAPKGLFTFTNFSLLFADLEWSALSALKGNHILEQLLKWLRVPSNGIWLNWIGLFLRESHTFLIKGFFEWKFAHFTRTWIARWIFTHFCSHHEAHGITKGLPACFFKMDTTS